MNTPTYQFGLVQSTAYRLIRQRTYAALERYGLNPTGWSLLGLLANAPDGIRYNEIASQMQVKAPLVTALAQDLEKRGLVQSVQNQFDARAKLLALTADGKKFVNTVEADLYASLSPLLEGVAEADVETYYNVLLAIIANDEKLSA